MGQVGGPAFPGEVINQAQLVEIGDTSFIVAENYVLFSTENDSSEVVMDIVEAVDLRNLVLKQWQVLRVSCYRPNIE